MGALFERRNSQDSNPFAGLTFALRIHVFSNGKKKLSNEMCQSSKLVDLIIISLFFHSLWKHLAGGRKRLQYPNVFFSRADRSQISKENSCITCKAPILMENDK